MTATYEKIATTTLGSNQANVTFSSISGSYTDIVLIANTAGTDAGRSLAVQFNSDTGSNYSVTDLRGNGSAAASSRYSNETAAYLASSIAFATTLGNGIYILNVMNYSNTTTYKTTIGRNSTAATGVEAAVNVWRNTNAINAMKIFSNGSGNLLSGSVFTLYGIKAE